MGTRSIVQTLLDHGADINAASKHGTPLFQASQVGRLEVVRLLLGRGADVNVRGLFNRTPFQVATREGHTQVAQLLLEHDANEK